MTAILNAHWPMIINTIITAIIACVCTYYTTVVGMIDRIEKTNAKHSTEMMAFRQEFYKDKTDTFFRISKIENGLSKIEECLNGRLKPNAAIVEGLTVKIELIKKDIAILMENYHVLRYRKPT